MNRLTAQLLMLNEWATLASFAVAIVLGAVAAWALHDVTAGCRRIVYLWTVGLAGLALSGSTLMWVLAPAAADAGLLWVLGLASLGAFAAFGAVLYHASAARSIDAYETTGKAWMGFVPILNLALLMRPGRSRWEGPPAGTPASIARHILDPILVVGGIALLVATRGFDAYLQRTPLYDFNESTVLIEMIGELMTPEEAFEMEMASTSPMLPFRLDELTVLTEIEAEGTMLTLTYDMDEEVGFTAEFRDYLVMNQCAPAMFGHQLARGGRIVLNYRGPDRALLDSYTITGEDCVI